MCSWERMEFDCFFEEDLSYLGVIVLEERRFIMCFLWAWEKINTDMNLDGTNTKLMVFYSE